MSWQQAYEPVCTNADGCDPIDLVIEPQEHDIGAFSVRRTLPSKERQMVGPFIFFDQMGPAVLPADKPLDVRPHPHIGLATLTWLVEGSILHRDSLGYVKEIHPGEVNWMTAGSGIVHSERTPEALRGKEAPLFGLQVWMALPQDQERVDPSFQHYAADDIPQVEGEGWRAIVVAGCAWGVTSPVAVYSDTLYADVRMEAGATLTVSADHEERAVYALTGEIEIAGASFSPGRMLVLKPGMDVELRAKSPCHFMLIGGAAMDGPRIKWWNFVASSRDLINQAKEDWKEGRFTKVPGDEEEFIPLPEKIRVQARTE